MAHVLSGSVSKLRLVPLAITLALLAAPGRPGTPVARAEEPSASSAPHAEDSPTARPAPSTGRKIYDAAVLRPFGFVQVISSAAMYAVFYLPALATGTADELTEICITQPVEQTFRKPLGEL
jgi:hypothetical protein